VSARITDTTKARAAVADLIGAPWDDSRKCWGAAVDALRRLGIDAPEEQAYLGMGPELCDSVPMGAPLQPGDVLVLDGAESLHVGVCLGGDQFIHATREGGTRLDRVSVWVRAGAVRNRLRPRAREARA